MLERNIVMSRRERNRLVIMVAIKSRELTVVQAADLLGLGYRQAKRGWRRYQAEGDAGLVHRLRGKPSARRKPPARQVGFAPEASTNAGCGDVGPGDFLPAPLGT